MSKIRCTDVAYRSGEIEVLAAIHAGHINLETWQSTGWIQYMTLSLARSWQP
jgi:hypothetical protein